MTFEVRSSGNLEPQTSNHRPSRASRQSRSALLRRKPAILDPIWNRSSLTLQRLSPAPWPEEIR